MLAGSFFLSSCTNDDEIDEASAAILEEMPRGSAFSHAVKAIEGLGFSCNAGQVEYRDAGGQLHRGPPHLRCQRDEPFLLFCTRRTSAILIQVNGRLINVLVNVGRFC